MRRPYIKQNRVTNLVPGLFSIKTAQLVLTALTLSFATTSIAAWKNSADEAPEYVDSIHKWGAWEHDIEPAAGGLQQSSSQVLNARDSKVSLRTNSVSALAPQRPAVPAVPATPTTPAVPAISAAPIAPPAATPSIPIIINLPPTSSATPITNPNNVPSGTSGLY